MDARAWQAHTYHVEAQRSTDEAEMYREQRDRLVRALRAEDPSYWSYGRLARQVECSKRLIRQILESEPEEAAS
jgi:hypothetical protein